MYDWRLKSDSQSCFLPLVSRALQSNKTSLCAVTCSLLGNVHDMSLGNAIFLRILTAWNIPTMSALGKFGRCSSDVTYFMKPSLSPPVRSALSIFWIRTTPRTCLLMLTCIELSMHVSPPRLSYGWEHKQFP